MRRFPVACQAAMVLAKEYEGYMKEFAIIYYNIKSIDSMERGNFL